jgi:hypothetical protein
MNNTIESIEKAIVSTIIHSTTVGRIDEYLDTLDYLFERRRIEQLPYYPTDGQEGGVK